MLKITAVEALQDNYIWLIHDQQQRAAIVDPGEAGPVVSALGTAGLTPSAILITHSHHDHVGGIAELAEHYRIPVYGPAAEPVPGITHPLHGREQIRPGGMDAELEVLDIPGHTAAHIGYFGHNMLFCGDTLFTAGCGKVFDGTAEQLFHSLQKIAEFQEDTLIYCAHEYTEGNLRFAHMVEPDNGAILQRQERTHQLRANGLPSVPSTLAEEKATNPFLRCDTATVAKAAEKFVGRHLNSSQEVFFVLRSWKDCLN